MAAGRVSVMVRRLGLGCLGLMVFGSVLAVVFRAPLTARYAAQRLQGATTDDDRAHWADRLVGLDDTGRSYVISALHSSDASQREAMTAAIDRYLAGMEMSDPRAAGLSRSLMEQMGQGGEAGQAVLLPLVPRLMKSPEPDAIARCRDLVRAGIQSGSSTAKIQSIQMALRPEMGLLADVPPLLNDADAEVRRAAMLAVGPTREDAQPVMADEELFRWLHDPDPEVRSLCSSALKTRGLDAEKIHYARQLTHPDPVERLKLLVDLRWGEEAIKDPGPWLERLSRDPDPAVRLGAARVTVECQLHFTTWLDRMAERDPDPSVRRWAGYYRGLANQVKPTGYPGNGTP